MVTVDYFGRTGNNMFQYAMARLVAMHTGQMLKTEWNGNNFIEATEQNHSYCHICESKEPPTVQAMGDREDDMTFVGKCHHLHGYFQRAYHVNFYNEHRDIIRGFWKLPVYRKNTEDLVVHFRLTDYWWYRNNCVINPKWYFNIIRKENYKKLYIVVEPHVTNTKYFSHFQQLRPEIVSMSPKEDFNFLMGFDRIICSNSTFAWWAAFLSNASKIWTFKTWMGKENNISEMAGAKVVPGEFIIDRGLMNIDWTDYWKKPLEYFKRR